MSFKLIPDMTERSPPTSVYFILHTFDFRRSNNSRMGVMYNRDYYKRQGGGCSTYTTKRMSTYYDNRERERESRYS